MSVNLILFVIAITAAFLGCTSLFTAGLLTRRDPSGRRRRGSPARKFPDPKYLTPAGRRLYWTGAALLLVSVATLLVGFAR